MMEQRIDSPVPPTMPANGIRGERGPWVPSRSDMDSYCRREVEMCAENILRGTATAQAHTLFSQRTWDLAVTHLGGMPTLDPKTIEHVERIRAAAIAAGDRSNRFYRGHPSQR